MKPKERLLAALTGRDLDRVPWSPFLAYFWESLPKAQRDKGQLQYLQEIGADPLLRGSHCLFSVKRNRCEITETVSQTEKITEYHTPVGTLQAGHTYSAQGDTWFIQKHPVQSAEDFKTLAFLNEDMQLEADLTQFEHDWRRIGPQALLLPVIGSEFKTSFQSLVEYWVGTEQLVYALMDYPDVVEQCLQAMGENSSASVEIALQTEAEGFIFWEDSSTTNVSPALLRQYILPEINQWGRAIHGAGKHLIHHACGHIRHLLPDMAAAEIDAIESISPPPTGDIELWEARDMLPDQIALIGGIEPTVFLNSSIDQLESYVLQLLQRMGTQRFVLANSDSCPPGVSREKFEFVSDLVRQHQH